MKNKIYIIPGQGQSVRISQYKKLISALKEKGYEVVGINPSWYKALSPQIFPIEKDSIIIGFSYGAILAYLVAKKYPCKKLILASLSPIHKDSFETLTKDFSNDMTEKQAVEVARDIKSIKINLQELKCPYVTFAGIKEKAKADFLVPNTGHEMTDEYIKCISELL